MTRYKPMKGVDMTKRLDEIRFPVYVAQKYDGVRAYASKDGVFGTGGLVFPQCQAVYAQHMLSDLDAPMDPRFRDCAKGLRYGTEYEVLHKDGAYPGVASRIAGILNRKTPSDEFYDLRWQPILEYGAAATHDRMLRDFVVSRSMLDQRIADALVCGMEGLMLRGGDFTYKHGKATAKCQRLMKIKFREECEAALIGREWNSVAGQGQRVTKLVWHVTTGKYTGQHITTGCPGDDLKRAIEADGMDLGSSYYQRIAEIEYLGTASTTTPVQPVFKRWKGDV